MLQTYQVDATFKARLHRSRVQMPVEASNGATAILAVEHFYRRVKPRAKLEHATAWPKDAAQAVLECARKP